MTNSDYKNRALSVLKGNWTPSVLATVIVFLVMIPYGCLSQLPNFLHVASNIMLAVSGSALIYFALVGCPFEIAYYGAMRQHIVAADDAVLGNMWKIVTSNWIHLVWGYVLMGIKLFLWSLLLFIPGIIKSFSYAMTPFILVEYPDLSASEAIQLSRRMMSGHKFDLFYLYLSFIGWFIVGVISLGIGFLWIMPYMTGSIAAFYEDVKSQYNFQHPLIEEQPQA